MKDKNLKTDFLIIGSGISGLRAAIELGNKGKKVLLVTKSKLEDSNTYYAQGGIAAIDPLRVEKREDSYDFYYNDTIKAGKGLCNENTVNRFIKQSYETIQFLINQGIQFTKGSNGYKYELHQEGGHKKERIYCVGDYTGKEIEEKLTDSVRNNPNIKIFENHTAISLITENGLLKNQSRIDKCLGAYILDRGNNKIRTFQTKKTFLATGGAGRVFQYTSNPENATGDGLAMAYKAGARVANMEFFQFHPSVLYEPKSEESSEKRFLLTEALRGEKMGGILTLEKDSIDDFVLKYDSEGSHATRDIVARAIDTEIKLKGLKHVWLNTTANVTNKTSGYIIENFPKIYEKCKSQGIDITKEPIPVVPAAHYMCGGIVVNDFGLTDINNLYAIGEVACTGIMGANRLASNSLTEAALYGKLAVEHAILSNDKDYNREIPEWDFGLAKYNVDIATMNQFWDITRTTMTNLCGIDRNEQRLKLAIATVNSLNKAADDIYRNFNPTHEIIELRNITLVAKLIAESAILRKESRGCHYRSDFRQYNNSYKIPTIISNG